MDLSTWLVVNALRGLYMILVATLLGCLYEYVISLRTETARLCKRADLIEWILLFVQVILVLSLTLAAVYVWQSPTSEDYTLHKAQCQHVEWYSPWDQNVTVIWKLSSSGLEQESPRCTVNDTLPPFTVFQEEYLSPRECCYRSYPVHQDIWPTPQPPQRITSCTSLKLGKCPLGPGHIITSWVVQVVLIWANIVVLVTWRA